MPATLDRRGLIATGAALVLSGCASRGAVRLSPPDEATPEGLETLQAVWADPEGLMVVVASQGCTARADIVFYVDRGEPKRPKVAFGRRRVDACGRPSAPVTLRFSYEELGLVHGEKVVIANPIAPARR